MENIPVYISIMFIITTLLTLFFFYRGTNRSKLIVGVVIVWMAVLAIPGLAGFFTVTDTIPPRFPLVVGPPILAILLLLLTPKGRQLVDRFDTKWLTYLHMVRIPVEIVLFLLFIHKQVPELMTFEGRNFDILSGLTAGLIAYFGYNRHKLSRTVLLVWNFICLGLLINIVTIAILSVPTPFQRLAFDQPNVGVLYFPFIWLPGVIVPAVLLSHLVSIRQLISSSPRHSQYHSIYHRDVPGQQKYESNQV